MCVFHELLQIVGTCAEQLTFDLFQGLAFSFRNELPDENEADQTHRREQEDARLLNTASVAGKNCETRYVPAHKNITDMDMAAPRTRVGKISDTTTQ